MYSCISLLLVRYFSATYDELSTTSGTEASITDQFVDFDVFPVVPLWIFEFLLVGLRESRHNRWVIPARKFLKCLV